MACGALGAMLFAAACQSFQGSDDATERLDASVDAAVDAQGDAARAPFDAAEEARACSRYDGGGAFCDDFDRSPSLASEWWTTECDGGKVGIVGEGLSAPNALATELELASAADAAVFGTCRAVFLGTRPITRSLLVRASMRMPTFDSDYAILTVVEGLPFTLQLVRFRDQSLALKVLRSSDGAELQVEALLARPFGEWTDVTIRVEIGSAPTLAVAIGPASEQQVLLLPDTLSIMGVGQVAKPGIIGLGLNQIAGTSPRASVLVDDVAIVVDAPAP